MTLEQLDPIRQKFKQLVWFDERQRQKEELKQRKQSIEQIIKPSLKNNQLISNNNIIKIKQQPQKKIQIYTKTDIVKQISKFKPYLQFCKNQLTSSQIQDLKRKQITSKQRNRMNQIVIYYNKLLCQQIKHNNKQIRIKQQQLNRQKKQKQGWIFEIYYRTNQLEIDLKNNKFLSVYVVLSDMIELYDNLTFTSKILQISMDLIKRIRYSDQNQYEIIQILWDQHNLLHLGFLNQMQIKLFDRLLFLQKNMARTSNNRLFTNQLIKNVYSEY